jgi:hypothetical protein
MADDRAGQGQRAEPEVLLLENPISAEHPPRSAPVRRRRAGRVRFSLTVVLTLVGLALAFGYLTLAYTGRTLALPNAAVAEVESRLNRGLVGAQLPKGTALSLESAVLAVDGDFVPRVQLKDLRLIDTDGRSLLTLPELRVAFDPGAALVGQVRPTSVRVIGARLSVRRDAEGRIDLEFPGGVGGGPKSLGEVLDAVVGLTKGPALSALHTVEAEGLSLTLTDDRAGREWQVGDGRLTLTNEDDRLAAELGMTLISGMRPAQATLTLIVGKADGGARLTAGLDQIAAPDVAAFSPPLAFLAAVQAPISGALDAEISSDGTLADLEARLELGAGTIAPEDGVRPIAFDRAGLSLRYDPAAARLTLSELAVESRSLRVRASGHGDLKDAAGSALGPGETPDHLLAQIAFSDVMVDPEGLFQEPVRFSEGALDLRLRLAPLRLDIGQLALIDEAGDRTLLHGAISAEAGGWSGAVDISVNQIDAGRLLKLWPVSVVPKTRRWFADNVGQASLGDVRAALRLSAGKTPRFALGYEFAEAEVRIVRTLPPVVEARGHATLEDNTYTVQLERGRIIPPEGGAIEADGSVFQVLDVTERPATAKITLRTRSSLTAALSLLDQEPFSFFSKAGQPVNLGDGRAELTATLYMPLKPRVTLPDVSFVVGGKILDFTSPSLVPGRILTSPSIEVAVDTEGLSLSGKGMLDILPVDLTYVQGFGPEQNGRARVNGTVTLSDAALRDLGIELPPGSVKGEGPAAIDIALVKGLPPQLTLTSTLAGLALRLDAVGWSKPARTRGALDLEARLSRTPVIERMTLSAPGLKASGTITTREGGGLEVARFDRVQAGDWLDAPVTLTGSRRNRAPEVAVTGGRIDLRAMPDGQGGGAGGGRVQLALDRLVISRGIALTDFRGEFLTAKGLDGQFSARVNGGGEIRGAIAPSGNGNAIRILSDNAGAVMASAGIFDKGRGGQLDMTLTPRGPEGQYDGIATFTRMRVQGAPALAELLSAISVVGLLEQMNGEGLAFNNGEVRFVLTPEAVEISQGSAVGASLGISFAGLYQSGNGRLDLQGVISPIYLVNGIGQIFSRRGEGLFGFNYRVTGTSDAPKVSVNPLSVLTPGMFREIFRQAPPNLKDAAKDPGG